MSNYDYVHISHYSDSRVFATLYRGKDGLEIEIVMPADCIKNFSESLIKDGFVTEKPNNDLIAFYREYQ